MKRFLFSVTLFLCSVFAFAQNGTVIGRIVDSGTGEGVPFATVVIKGTTTGVAADADGNYSISAGPESVLIFGSIGYMDAEETVGTRTRINVALKTDAMFLDETIVVAYGVQKKSSFTGAATQLSGDKLATMQSSNISKSLEGAVAGLQTSSASGTPGSSADLIIRGIGSVTAKQSPLLVVDGVPYEGSLNSIAQQDIESLTILKDAAANSMYGARGSNGVVIITTKRGTAERVRINFNAKVGFNTRGVPAYDVITDPGDYYEMTWEAIRNSVYCGGQMGLAQANAYASGALINNYLNYNIYKGVENDEVILPENGKLNPNATQLKWTDNWNKDVFRSGIRQEYDLSVSGGSDKTQAYMSVAYLNDEGYVPNSGFDRISLRAKVDQTITKWLSAGVNISYVNTKQETFGTESSGVFSNLFYFGQNVAPIYPIYKYDIETGERQYAADGSPLYDWGENRAYGQLSNPYGQLKTSQRSTISDNISSRGYLRFQVLKDLRIEANVAFDVFDERISFFTTPVGGDAAIVNGRSQQQMSRYTALNANQLITYYPTFGKHGLTILLGHETKSDNSYYLTGEKTNAFNPNVGDFANLTNYIGLSSATSGYFLEGVFGRAEYDYDQKYMASLSYRVDGSSRFSKQNRWGDFWSVGLAWNMKNEGFLRSADWLNALKIKASYGTQGNDAIGMTKVYEDTYGVTSIDGVASVVKTFRAAPDVTWEKSQNFNIGFESAWLDRIRLNVDFFYKQINDMIYYRPLAPSQGDPANQLVNDMDMNNTGVELDLNVDIIKSPSVYWSVGINGTHYKNKITRIPSDQPQDGYPNGNYWREVGGSLYDFYIYEWCGPDPETGAPRYAKYDENGNKTMVNNTTNATFVKTHKSSIPDFYGGFNTALAFFGFELSASFAYQIGGWTLDSNYQSLMGGGTAGSNWHKDIFNRWTPQNRNTDVPRVEMSNNEIANTSTRFLTKASYISLRNVTIGYTIPKRVTDKIKMQNLKVFVTGDNLWYTSKRRGLDVRQSFNGATGFTYSALRTVSAGVSVTF